MAGGGRGPRRQVDDSADGGGCKLPSPCPCVICFRHTSKNSAGDTTFTPCPALHRELLGIPRDQVSGRPCQCHVQENLVVRIWKGNRERRSSHHETPGLDLLQERFHRRLPGNAPQSVSEAVRLTKKQPLTADCRRPGSSESDSASVTTASSFSTSASCTACRNRRGIPSSL